MSDRKYIGGPATIFCPDCGSPLVGVTDTRSVLAFGKRVVARRRRCKPCGKKVVTYEVTEDVLRRADAMQQHYDDVLKRVMEALTS